MATLNPSRHNFRVCARHVFNISRSCTTGGLSILSMDISPDIGPDLVGNTLPLTTIALLSITASKISQRIHKWWIHCCMLFTTHLRFGSFAYIWVIPIGETTLVLNSRHFP